MSGVLIFNLSHSPARTIHCYDWPNVGLTLNDYWQINGAVYDHTSLELFKLSQKQQIW